MTVSVNMGKQKVSNLDYYIKYPKPNFNYDHNEDGHNFSFLTRAEKIPVVVLLGWAGCQDKHLAKYSEVYEKKGLITLRFTAPLECLMLGKYKLMFSLGENLVKLFIDLDLDSHPIIVHCFSNNGAFLYQTMAAAMEKSPKKISIKGVIFDSAPGQRRVLPIYKAVSNGLFRRPTIYNFPLSFLLTAFLCVLWMYEVTCDTIWPGSKIVLNPMKNLMNEPNRWPQLFIYSKCDEMILLVDIEEFADYRQKLGVDVTTVCYDNSQHVKHFAENQENYIDNVYRFVRKCLVGIKEGSFIQNRL